MSACAAAAAAYAAVQEHAHTQKRHQKMYNLQALRPCAMIEEEQCAPKCALKPHCTHAANNCKRYCPAQLKMHVANKQVLEIAQKTKFLCLDTMT
jgi:hypothetical protein